MKKALLVIVAAIMINTILYSAFAFAHSEINPLYWVAEWRAFCAFLMGAITFAILVFFIITEIQIKNNYDLDKD